MSKGDRPLTPRGRLLFGGLFVAMGIFPMWLSVTDPGSVNGPWWLGFVAGAVFAVAGLAVATRETPVGPWVGPLSVALIFLGLAAIGNWIAFGPGPRVCSGGVSFLFFSGRADAGGLGCRVGFGVGAVLLDALVVMALLHGVARLAGNQAWSRRVQGVGTVVLAVAVSPLILLAALLSAYGALKDKVVAWRSRTG